MASAKSTWFRRSANRLLGNGPCRLASFAEIAHDATSPTPVGVHRPERFAGVLKCEAGEPQHYEAALSLLGQPPSWESIQGEPRYREKGLACASPKMLFSLCDACIAGSDGVVYDPCSRRAVEESVRCWVQSGRDHPLLGAVNLPGAQRLEGISLSLASLDSEGFYHFLHEALPRLWLARDFRAHIDHVLVGGSRDAQREAWLQLAGVPVDRIVWLGGLAHLRCDQLLFTNVPLRDYQPTAWNLNALNRLFSQPKAESDRWLWISRSDARTRHLTWEDELLRRFDKFEKVVLGSMSPAEQVRLFSGASVVAGPHGAGLSLLAFCPPGGRFVEFFPNGHRQPVFARLAEAAGLRKAWAMVDFNRSSSLDPLTAALSRFLDVSA